MFKRIKAILVIISILVSFLLFQNIDLAIAKDPDYPTKPITFYISFGAGGSTDLASRAFAEAAAKHIGQPFVCINKPGAGGTLAAMAIMSAKPDGYTLGPVSTGASLVAPLSGTAPYKDLTGIEVIVNFGKYIYLLVVRDDSPWKTWKDFIEWARMNPRAAKVGIVGAKTASAVGFITRQIEDREDVELTGISLKSSAEVLQATLGGHITLFNSTTDPSVVEYIKEGKLRILYYASPEKLPGYENISCCLDLYGDEFCIPNFLGVMGPRGLPDYVLKKLDDAFAKAVKDPDFISLMKRMYMPVVYMNRDQMNNYVEEGFTRMGRIIKYLESKEKAKGGK